MVPDRSSPSRANKWTRPCAMRSRCSSTPTPPGVRWIPRSSRMPMCRMCRRVRRISTGPGRTPRRSDPCRHGRRSPMAGLRWARSRLLRRVTQWSRLGRSSPTTGLHWATRRLLRRVTHGAADDVENRSGEFELAPESESHRPRLDRQTGSGAVSVAVGQDGRRSVLERASGIESRQVSDDCPERSGTFDPGPERESHPLPLGRQARASAFDLASAIDTTHVGRSATTTSTPSPAVHRPVRPAAPQPVPVPEPTPPIVPAATQTIPPRIRRLVWRRDHQRCTVPGCRAVGWLEIHHVVPPSGGGTTIRLECSCCVPRTTVASTRAAFASTASRPISSSSLMRMGRPWASWIARSMETTSTPAPIPIATFRIGWKRMPLMRFVARAFRWAMLAALWPKRPARVLRRSKNSSDERLPFSVGRSMGRVFRRGELSFVGVASPGRQLGRSARPG